jgi:hypothetical protein
MPCDKCSLLGVWGYEPEEKKNHKIQCASCGKSFWSNTSFKKYCSSKCYVDSLKNRTVKYKKRSFK